MYYIFKLKVLLLYQPKLETRFNSKQVVTALICRIRFSPISGDNRVIYSSNRGSRVQYCVGGVYLLRLLATSQHLYGALAVRDWSGGIWARPGLCVGVFPEYLVNLILFQCSFMSQCTQFISK